jgi:CubicO group peptidase (beta-lactamase class C family)
MNRRNFIVRLAWVGAAAGCGLIPALSPAFAADDTHHGDADRLVEKFRTDAGVPDVSLSVMRGDQTLYSGYFGTYRAGTIVPLASASKWVAGAVIMALVDRGLLRLDAPISTYVDGLPAVYGVLRLEQLMSYTAGLPGLMRFIEFKQPPTLTLAQSAQQAAQQPLATTPGSQFDYGGPNLQFLGAAAERVTGKPWQQIFMECLGTPIGMRSSLWGGLLKQPRADHLDSNPMLQAGLWTTLDDMNAFVTLIAQRGNYRGKQILSAKSVQAMDTVMTHGVRKGFTAPGASGTAAEYMIAHWCEKEDAGQCSFESSPGLFGAYPWVDHASNLYGMILLKDRLQRIAGQERTLRNGLIALYR